jgi:hypothetical protein
VPDELPDACVLFLLLAAARHRRAESSAGRPSRRHKVKRIDQPIRGIAGDHIDLSAGESFISQAEIHHARRHLELKLVEFRQARITIFPFDEFIAKTRRPLSGIRAASEIVFSFNFSASSPRTTITTCC